MKHTPKTFKSRQKVTEKIKQLFILKNLQSRWQNSAKKCANHQNSEKVVSHRHFGWKYTLCIYISLRFQQWLNMIREAEKTNLVAFAVSAFHFAGNPIFVWTPRTPRTPPFWMYEVNIWTIFKDGRQVVALEIDFESLGISQACREREECTSWL